MLDKQLEELTQRIAIEFYRAKSMMMGSVPNKPKVYGPVILPMTGPITGNQIASSVNTTDRSNGAPWNAFMGEQDLNWTTQWSCEFNQTPSKPAWIQIEFTDGPRTIEAYNIRNRGNVSSGLDTRSPRSWELLGRNSDTDEWTQIHYISTNNNTTSQGIRSFSNFGEHTYSQFRLNIFKAVVPNTGTPNGYAVFIDNLQLFGKN